MAGRLPYSVIFFIVLLSSCARDPYDPENFLTQEDRKKLIREMVYYSMKLAPNANHETKFDKEFDWYYDLAAKEVEILKYYVNNSDHFFLMSRVARSLQSMREGIAGKVRYDDKGRLIEYEEIFRTWKMPGDSLNVRGAMLFDRMVKGKDLSLFYSKFQGDKYIEFPDERFSFDKKLKLWHDAASDTLQIE